AALVVEDDPSVLAGERRPACVGAERRERRAGEDRGGGDDQSESPPREAAHSSTSIRWDPEARTFPAPANRRLTAGTDQGAPLPRSRDSPLTRAAHRSYRRRGHHRTEGVSRVQTTQIDRAVLRSGVVPGRNAARP